LSSAIAPMWPQAIPILRRYAASVVRRVLAAVLKGGDPAPKVALDRVPLGITDVFSFDFLLDLCGVRLGFPLAHEVLGALSRLAASGLVVTPPAVQFLPIWGRHLEPLARFCSLRVSLLLRLQQFRPWCVDTAPNPVVGVQVMSNVQAFLMGIGVSYLVSLLVLLLLVGEPQDSRQSDEATYY
jgi:hypothetical protein